MVKEAEEKNGGDQSKTSNVKESSVRDKEEHAGAEDYHRAVARTEEENEGCGSNVLEKRAS